jgi:hypothetical protein
MAPAPTGPGPSAAPISTKPPVQNGNGTVGNNGPGLVCTDRLCGNYYGLGAYCCFAGNGLVGCCLGNNYSTNLGCDGLYTYACVVGGYYGCCAYDTPLYTPGGTLNPTPSTPPYTPPPGGGYGTGTGIGTGTGTGFGGGGDFGTGTGTGISTGTGTGDFGGGGDFGCDESACEADGEICCGPNYGDCCI